MKKQYKQPNMQAMVWEVSDWMTASNDGSGDPAEPSQLTFRTTGEGENWNW